MSKSHWTNHTSQFSSKFKHLGLHSFIYLSVSLTSKLSVIHLHHHMLWNLGPCSKRHISASRYWEWQSEKQPQPFSQLFTEGLVSDLHIKGDENPPKKKNGPSCRAWAVMKMGMARSPELPYHLRKREKKVHPRGQWLRGNPVGSQLMNVL